MKKTLLTVLISLFSLSVFCGDLATFVDLGFSKDGKKYMFGQYGVTDSEIQGYAEIYIVDVEKNEYVEGGVFRRLPSKETEGKDGKGLFNMLCDGDLSDEVEELRKRAVTEPVTGDGNV